MKRLVDSLAPVENSGQFVAGVRDSLPIYLGFVPFGIVVGFTAVDLGLTPLEATVMSALLYAGAAQLAAVFLMAEGAGIALVGLTVFLINARFTMYSASLAPIFKPRSRVRKALYTFLIVDALYALAIPRFRRSDDGQVHRYYFGAGVSLWGSWIIGTMIGAGLDVTALDAFPVELVLPLVFLALLFPVIEDRPSAVTAIVAGGVAVVAAPLDYNAGLLVGAGTGLLVGGILNR